MNVRFRSVVLALLLLSVAACSSGSSNKAEASCTTGTGANGFLTLCGEGTSLPPCTLGRSYAELPSCAGSPRPSARLPGVQAPAGAALVTVPNVIGKTGNRAVATLKAAGLHPHVVNATPLTWKVAAQSLRAGGPVARGSIVLLQLSSR